MSHAKTRNRFWRVGFPIEVFAPSRTKQSFLAETDVNNIIKRYRVTGLLPQHQGDPMYADFSKLPSDYQDALNKVLDAEAAFNAVSSDVRSEFNNDPKAFISFCTDPANLDQLREWGLAPKPPAPPAPVAPEPPKAPVAPKPD